MSNHGSRTVKMLRYATTAILSVLARFRVGFGSYIQFTAEGRENLPAGPFVVCSNHSSHLDLFAILEGLELPHDKVMVIAAKDYHFDNSLMGFVHPTLFNLAPIDRRNPRDSLANCVAACTKFLRSGGRTIIAYPEGTRSPDGLIHKFRRGTAPILRSIGVPIVPAFVRGSFQSFSRHHIIPRPGRIAVKFGKPIEVSAPSAGTVKVSNRVEDALFVEAIETAVRQLAGERG